jgi:ABC-2 type transport system ATP-binding protein
MIKVTNITKNFGVIKAVDDISFSVNKGEILGFLGPNGAGKSTTMRIITGFIPQTSGNVLVEGLDVSKYPLETREKIGYLAENAPVYPDMTVVGFLRFCAEIRGFSGKVLKKKVSETIEKCFLKSVEFQTIDTLSKGYKQRVSFAQSIIHDPKYLILDEPTDGLDPNQKHEIRTMIREMSKNKTIILSSHILEEVDIVCSRAIIIGKGSIIADETPKELRKRSKFYGAVSALFNHPVESAIISDLKKHKAIKQVDVENYNTGLTVFPKTNKTAILNIVFTILNNHNTKPVSVFVSKGRLDEVFRSLTSAHDKTVIKC